MCSCKHQNGVSQLDSTVDQFRSTARWKCRTESRQQDLEPICSNTDTIISFLMLQFAIRRQHNDHWMYNIFYLTHTGAFLWFNGWQLSSCSHFSHKRLEHVNKPPAVTGLSAHFSQREESVQFCTQWLFFLRLWTSSCAGIVHCHWLVWIQTLAQNSACKLKSFIYDLRIRFREK